MKHGKTIKKPMPQSDLTGISLPITFHYAVEQLFEAYAEGVGLKPDRLRQTTLKAIRTHHREAIIEHPCQRGDELGPDCYTLRRESFSIYFSIEPHAVVVRGYGWEIDGEPLDDFDGGGCARN